VAAKLKAAGVRLLLERGAGAAAHFPDAAYTDAEFSDAASILASADVLLKVQPPSIAEVNALKRGAVVIGYMQAYARPDLVRALKDRGITALAMELVPRISRAQSMDALSSQASVAGYKAVLIAANTLEKFFPCWPPPPAPSVPPRCWASAPASPACRPSPPQNAWAPWSKPTMCAARPRSRSNRWARNSSRPACPPKAPAATRASSPPKRRPNSRKFSTHASRPATP